MNRLKAKIRIGLFGKMILAMFLLAIIPLGMASYRLISLNREAFSNQVLNLHAVSARATANRVTSFLRARAALASYAANRPVLYSDPRSEEARGVLTDLLASPDEIGVIMAAFLNADNQEIMRAQSKSRADQVERILPAFDGHEFKLVQDDGLILLLVEAPAPDGQVKVRLVFEAMALREFLRPEELGEEADIVLGSLDDGVLLGSRTDLSGMPEAVMTRITTGRVSGSGRYTADLGELLCAHAPIEGAPWYILSWQPAHVAEKIAGTMRQKSLQSLALAIGIAGLLAIAAFKTVISPLRRIVKQQALLAGSSKHKPKGDEIDQLKETFNALERHLEDRESLDKVFLGRYQVLRMIGEGAMGTVWHGWDPKLQRPVALKTIRMGVVNPHAAPDTLASRLLHEAVTAGRVQHSNVVGIYDVEDSAELAFVAMEYVDGVNLEDYLGGTHTIPPGKTAALALEVAKGLVAAHDRRILHRDIKPGNILLSRGGGIKVTDFGISQLMNALNEDEDTIFGTPGYLPPETINGMGYTESGDLFALGVVMYRCLTGRPPFLGRTSREVLVNTLVKEVTPINEIIPGIPLELDTLVVQLLEKNQARRLGSAQELVERLENMSFIESWEYTPIVFGEGVMEEWPSGLRTQLLDTVHLDLSDGSGGAA